VRINVLGEFMGFMLIYEEKLVGGILNWTFFVFWSVVRGSSLRRGDNLCYSFVNLGNLIVSSGGFGERGGSSGLTCMWVIVY
jgi:hypothetical protein